MPIDLSTIGNMESSTAGENLPEVLHAVADMVKTKGKLAKLGIGGSALGYDPKKHLDETLQHLGLGGEAAGGAGGGVDVNHVKEVIAQLRQMGGKAAGGAPGGMQPGDIPIEAGFPGSTTVMRNGQAVVIPTSGGAGHPLVPFQPQTGGDLGSIGGAVPPGSFNAQTGAELNPPPVIQGTGATTTAPPASTDTLDSLKFNLGITPTGSAAGGDQSSFEADLRQQERESLRKMDEIFRNTGVDRKNYDDAVAELKKGGVVPEAVGIEKVIGGRKHGLGDWLTLGLALVAALSGKSGQQLAGGILQGWFSGKQGLAKEETQHAMQQFQFDTEAKQQAVVNAARKLGIDDQMYNQLAAKANQLAGLIERGETAKANAWLKELQLKTLETDKLNREVTQTENSLNTAIKTGSFTAIKGAIDNVNKARSRAGRTDMIPDEAAVSAMQESPAFAKAVEDFNKDVMGEAKTVGLISPEAETRFNKRRDAMLARWQIPKDSPQAALVPEVPLSMETLASKKFGFLKSKTRQELLIKWKTLSEQEKRTKIMQQNADTNASNSTYKAWQESITAYNSGVRAKKQVLDETRKSLDEAVKGATKAVTAAEGAPAYVMPGKYNASQQAAAKKAYDDAVAKRDQAQKDLDSFDQNVKAGPTIKDDQGNTVPNLLDPGTEMPNVPKLHVGKKGAYSPDEIKTANAQVQKHLDEGSIDQTEANRRWAAIKAATGG
jgi:hypothetical protein